MLGDLKGVPDQRFAVATWNFQAAWEAAGADPFFERGAVVANAKRLQLGISQVAAAEVSAPEKARDQRVVRIAWRLHQWFCGTFSNREPSAFLLYFGHTSRVRMRRSSRAIARTTRASSWSFPLSSLRRMSRLRPWTVSGNAKPITVPALAPRG